MRKSLIICTRNRAERLRLCLRRVEETEYTGVIEVLIVNNGSTDHTEVVASDFVSTTKYTAKLVNCDERGLGRARNCGIENSTGDVLIFTDDDCYMAKDYFSQFDKVFDATKHQYGGGQILLYDASDDERCAIQKLENDVIITPKPVLRTGAIHGANMFFLRDIFRKVGLFNEDLGAGTDFPCEDIEMACRASRGGYHGFLSKQLVVYHHHGRKRKSKEAELTVLSYDYGRGAYYASLMLNNVQEVWSFWERRNRNLGFPGSKQSISRLARVMTGAAKYLEFVASKPN